MTGDLGRFGYSGPGRYRHYKGGEYEVLGVALREDSIDKGGAVSPVESKGEQFVIYRPLGCTRTTATLRSCGCSWPRRLTGSAARLSRSSWKLRLLMLDPTLGQSVSPGDRVQHPNAGTGRVVWVRGSTARVSWDSGGQGIAYVRDLTVIR